MAPGAPTPPPGPDDDPFRELLDPGFVDRATVREPTAAERAAAARAAVLARGPGTAGPGVPGGNRRPTRPGRSGRGSRIVGASVVVAVVVAVSLALTRGLPVDTPARGGSGATTAAPVPEPVKRRPSSWPSSAPTQGDRPLGAPPEVTVGGPHAFAATQDDGTTPVAWDPCRPVHYVVRPGGPVGAEVLVREAVDRVAAATGLRFVDDGATDEAPSPDRAPFQPDRYGDRWAPVLVAWSDRTETPGLGEQGAAGDTDVAGIGGASSAGWEGEPSIYVSGSLVLDAPDLAAVLSRPGGRDAVRAVIVHELAHVVGLGHVDDPSQLMHPSTVPGVVELAPGDLEGLAALGRGPCVPDV